MTQREPIILNESDLVSFEQQNEILDHVDIYALQCCELQRIYSLQDVHSDNQPPKRHIYFPWHKTLLTCVDEPAMFALRTNRNKNLVTAQEQQKLADITVGIAGMSVGAGIALGLVYSGMSNRIKISDHDVLDTSNLNRLRESLLAVGTSKVDLAARHIYEVNPYANVHIFDEGLTGDNIGRFFNDPQLTVVIDEIDDFKMKVQLRLHARKSRIPLLMFTSLGDNILIDVERYDQQPDLPLFHGLLTDVSEEILAKPNISPEDIRRYSVQLVGQEYIPTQALESVAEMGRTLVGRPQLYSTIAVDGGLAAFVVRKLILDNKPHSGRYFIKFSDLIAAPDTDFEDTPQRQEILNRLFSNAA